MHKLGRPIYTCAPGSHTVVSVDVPSVPVSTFWIMERRGPDTLWTAQKNRGNIPVSDTDQASRHIAGYKGTLKGRL